MKKMICAALMCIMMSSCVIGVRSNMHFTNHKNHATNEANLTDGSTTNGDSPAVNADKSYSDLLNGSGNSNGQRTGVNDEKSTEPAAAPAEPAAKTE